LSNIASVARFLRPQSVAIVGMSARKGSTGQVILQSLKLNDFAGPIYLIGRSTEPIDGRPVLQSPDELPEGVDLAVFVLPAAAVREAVAACVRRKVGSAIVFASGFAELGGREEQDAIAKMARDGGLAIVGPNCLGFTNNVDGFEVHLLFARRAQRFTADSKPGVAFIGQSGGLLGHFQRAAGAREMPVSYVVSIGNEAGLDATDFVEFLAQDRATSCIALYAEQIQRPQAFLQACARARAAGKPIVMLQATNIAYMSNAATVMAQQLRAAGMKVDLQPMDWANVVQRRASQSPPDQGGWNIFFTSASGLANSTPYMMSHLATVGKKGWFGWPTDEKNEQLRAQWMSAETLEQRKAIALQIQDNAWTIVPLLHFGQWIQPAAHRKNVTGWLHDPGLLVFWNVQKS